MNELDLNIGIQIYLAGDKHFRLAKVAVDLGSWQVTHLIVEEGLIMKSSQVLPIVSVERVLDGGLQLAIDPDDLTHYPEYREEVIESLAPGQVEDIPPTSSLNYGGPVIAAKKLPKKVRFGLPDHLAVIEMGIPLLGLDGQIGKLDHFLVKAGSGRITQLVIQQGFIFTTRRIIPISMVEHISERSVFVAASEDEAKNFPQYDRQDFEQGIEPQMVARPRKDTTGKSGHSGAGALETDLDKHIALVLYEDPRTSDAVIEVINDRGVITLQGRVEDLDVQRAAEAIAAEQPGVISVINELQVKHQAYWPRKTEAPEKVSAAENGPQITGIGSLPLNVD
jgi:hypothetical protein